MGKPSISMKKDFDATAFPAASIFLKLEKMNPELPSRIIDQALDAQRKRYINPDLQAKYRELEEEFFSRKKSWQEIIRATADKMGLSFLFKAKAAPQSQPTAAPIPAKPPNTMGQNLIFKPGEFSIQEDQENRFDIDHSTLGNDLREAVLLYINEHQQGFKLTPEEKQSLEPQI